MRLSLLTAFVVSIVIHPTAARADVVIATNMDGGYVPSGGCRSVAQFPRRMLRQAVDSGAFSSGRLAAGSIPPLAAATPGKPRRGRALGVAPFRLPTGCRTSSMRCVRPPRFFRLMRMSAGSLGANLTLPMA